MLRWSRYYERPKGWFLLKTTIFLRILFHTHRVRITLKTTEIKSSANLPETATKKAKHTNGATNRLIFEAVTPPAKRTFFAPPSNRWSAENCTQEQTRQYFYMRAYFNAPRSHFILRFAMCKLSRLGGKKTNFILVEILLLIFIPCIPTVLTNLSALRDWCY